MNLDAVAVDLDGVVADIVVSARMAAAGNAGIRVEDVVDTGIYWAPFSHPDAALRERLATGHSFWQRADVLEGAPAVPGAITALDRLHASGRLAAYVTRRPPSVRGLTLSWLGRKRAPAVPLLMVGHDDGDRNHLTSKADMCIAIGATMLVDDSHQEVAEALGRGLGALLVDHELGREARHAWRRANPGTPLVHDLDHAVRMIEDRT